jgi:2-dehydropantoate 2-reductase
MIPQSSGFGLGIHEITRRPTLSESPLPFPCVTIIGAGALGCFYGGRIAQTDRQVFLSMRSNEWKRAVSENGLLIRSVDGDAHVFPRVAQDPPVFEPNSLIIIGLKSFANHQLPTLLSSFCNFDEKNYPIVLTLQNGLGNEEAALTALQSILGEEKASSITILGGIAFLCSNRGEAGVIHHSAHGWIKAGWFSGPQPEDLFHNLANLWSSARIPFEWAPQLLAARYEKLVWNIPFNGLGAAFDLTVEDVLTDSNWLSLARGLMGEVVALAKAEGADLPSDVVELMIERSRSMGPYRSSMQVDREAGRPLEWEAILGEPLRRAQYRSVPTPYLEFLSAAVGQLKQSRLSPATTENSDAR